MSDRRVVITGIGIVSPLAATREATWERLLAGKSGAGRIDAFDPEDMPCKIAFQVPWVTGRGGGEGDPEAFDSEKFVSKKEMRRIDEFILYAIAAALGATLDSDVHMYFSFAVLCRLGHHCLLRPAEIMKLVVADLRLPRASFEPELIAIRLRDPKHRSSLGRFQFAMCRDPALVAWICWYVRDCPPDMPLLPGKQARFSKFFREIRDRLG